MNTDLNRRLLLDSSNIRIRTLKFGSVYERWYSSKFEPGWYLCFDWTRFWVFNIKLQLDIGYRLLRFASKTNIESAPRFAKIWYGGLVVLLNFFHETFYWSLLHSFLSDHCLNIIKHFFLLPCLFIYLNQFFCYWTFFIKHFYLPFCYL